jgi:drug/metabolite transporter (DMT)-like permease
MQRLTSQRTLGIFAIVLSSLIWGTIPLILRNIDGSPFIKVFFRVFIAFLTVGTWTLLSGRWRKIKDLEWPTIRWLLAQGALLALNWVLFFGAFDFTTVATVELLGYMGPVFVALLIPLFLKERFDKRIVLPLVLSLVGVIVVLIPHGFGFSAEFASQVGAGMALASALTYATLILMAKRISAKVPVDLITMFEGFGASAVLLPLVIWSYVQGNTPTGGFAPYAWLIVLGVMHTGFTGVLFFYGLKQLRADQAAVLTYLEPISAIVFAGIFLGEGLSWLTLVGGILIVVGGAIVSRLDAEGDIDPAPIELIT